MVNVFFIKKYWPETVKKRQNARQFWQWSEYVRCILASFTLVQRKRKGCDYSLSLACLIAPLIGTPFVCVPPAFYYRKWSSVEISVSSSRPHPWRMIHRQVILSQVGRLYCCRGVAYHISLQQRPIAPEPAYVSSSAEWRRRWILLKTSSGCAV